MHRFLIFFTLALAAPAAGEPLSWDACLAEAAAGNPDLEAARAALAKARIDRQAALSPFLPQLSGGADTSENRTLGLGVSSREYGWSLSARQNLFSGFRDYAGRSRTSAALDSAQAGYEDAAARVTLELRRAFTALLYAQEQTVLTLEIAARRRENARLVELRYEAGREHRGSYLRSNASWKQAEFEVAQAKRALRVAQRELLSVLGRGPFEVVAATGSLWAVEAPQGNPDFMELVRRTPVYRIAEAQVRSAQAGVTAADGRFYPDLDASVSLSRSGEQWPPEQPRRLSAGLSLSFPFFPGGGNFFGAASSRAERRRAQADFLSAQYSSALDLENAFAFYQDAAERTAVQEQFLEAARVRAQIARSQYTSGLISFQEWDLIENDLIASQKSWLSALRDAANAQAAWDRVQGKGSL
ncbi:MAG: TolC family protein [Elusimicrobia bacterium]|nr:TolC family protein [Elusimicrobiota bacterium]